MARNGRKNTVRVRVVSPDATLFDGVALGLVSINDTGEFTVLPQHINFISLIRDRAIVMLPGGERKIIPLEAGVIRCQGGVIEVFAGLSLLAPG